MVLEIRLENFYSIRDEVMIDFRAANINTATAKALSANVIDRNGEKALKCVGLFGANASGKSNVIKAIAACVRLILDSHQYNEGKVFGFAPFRFGGHEDKPSVFTIEFIHDGIEYEYSFALTNTEIRKESLYHYPNGRRAKVFVRDETRGTDKAKTYGFGDGVIPRPFDVATNTSRKSLYLSRASQMDRELCKRLYNFFSNNLLVEFAPMEFKKLDAFGADILFARNKDLILHALSICDSDISDIVIARSPKIPIDTYDTTIEFLTFHKADPEIPFDLNNGRIRRNATTVQHAFLSSGRGKERQDLDTGRVRFKPTLKAGGFRHRSVPRRLVGAVSLHVPQHQSDRRETIPPRPDNVRRQEGRRLHGALLPARPQGLSR